LASDPADILAKSTALITSGKDAEALKLLQPAVRHHPDDSSLFVRLGDAFFFTRDLRRAQRAYERALKLDDSLAAAWSGQGMVNFSRRAFADAVVSFRRAADFEPGNAQLRFQLGKALYQMGDVDAAIDELTLAAKNPQMRQQALRQIAVIIPGGPSCGNRAILQARRKWYRLEARLEPVASRPPNRPYRSQKLRVGYVSSFFQDRNWMKPVWGVINHHDRSRFEVHLFADRGDPTPASGYRKHSLDSIHDITALSNGETAKKIRKARIDVLVDLNSYSAPARLGIFSHRPARNIVAWFNAYATTGLRVFDHIIGDEHVIPVNEEHFYAERVLRVAGSYLAFSVLYSVPRITPPPCLRNGFITFGSLAPQYKITPEVVAAWAEILGAVPSARLLLKSRNLADESNRAYVLAQFSRNRITKHQLILEGPEEHYRFLKAYSRMDISLDTFPYNGGTTTMESIWQGVPVLTFSGDRWVARISRSILTEAGLANWVLSSKNAYVRRAVDLALSPETPKMLATLRSSLREQVRTSAACDSEGLCRSLEEKYLFLTRGSGPRP
jgi:protein O-GlcNAc transferase